MQPWVVTAVLVLAFGGLVGCKSGPAQPSTDASPPAAKPAAGPGAAAFREFTDGFVDHEMSANLAQRAAMGLTQPVVKELTYFALLSLEAENWDMVEWLTGRALAEDVRGKVHESTLACSRETETELTAQIAAGGSDETRLATLDRIEAKCLATYYKLTGMTPELLDQLLLESVKSGHVNHTAKASLGR